ncbi:O-antigen ligase family protein [Paenibacillus sp. AN1007]|uniref:O-antigen ligase family protein n=1 Tax=Paenibacillus sp. AN1007 TaxID=3151385 RepID=A0AAU8NES1_9BACL
MEEKEKVNEEAKKDSSRGGAGQQELFYQNGGQAEGRGLAGRSCQPGRLDELPEYGCYLAHDCNTYNDTAGPHSLWVTGRVSDTSSRWSRTKEKKSRTDMNRSNWTAVLGMGTLVVLLAGCLRRGLFFSADVYPVILMTAVIVSISLVMYIEGMLETQPAGMDMIRLEFMRPENPQFIQVLFPLVVMMCYAVHALAGSVSTQGSIDEMLRWSLLAMFALLAALLAASRNGVRWIALGWQLAGGLLVLSGILAVCGVMPLPYGIMRTADPEISSAGARLGGLLQYPNAYGAVACMYALERLTAAAGVLAGRAVPARRLIAAVLPLMPAQAALLLSESRGAWLAAGCAAAAALALQRRGARLPLLLALAAPLACAAWLYRQLAAAQLAPAPVPGLLALAGAWAAALLGTLLLCRLWHSRARAGRAAALATTVLACIAAALMAAASTADRFAAGVGTGASRLQMWRDALQLWTEAAWLGHGGNTWRSMFRAIQSSPYVGGEVHSGLLDLALDTGLLGIALIAGWMLFTLHSMRRFAPRLLPAVLVFALHGAVDFDWSYALSWMLFIWLTAWAAALRRETEVAALYPYAFINGSVSAAAPAPKSLVDTACAGSINDAASQPVNALQQSKRYSYHLTLQAIRLRLVLVHASIQNYIRPCIQLLSSPASRPIRRYTAEFLLACWLGGTVWITAHYMWAAIQYRQAIAEPMETSTSVEYFKSAYHLNPARPDLAISFARTLPYAEAHSILLNGLSYSPQDPDLYLELGKRASQSGQGKQAGTYFIKAISLNRYEQEIYRAAVHEMEQIAMHEISHGRARQAQQTAAVGAQIYEQYKNLAAQVNAEYIRSDRHFQLDSSSALSGENLRSIAAGTLIKNKPYKSIRSCIRCNSQN